jgi:hypothetical protein
LEAVLLLVVRARVPLVLAVWLAFSEIWEVVLELALAQEAKIRVRPAQEASLVCLKV